jgi:hypothetical protein
MGEVPTAPFELMAVPQQRDVPLLTPACLNRGWQVAAAGGADTDASRVSPEEVLAALPESMRGMSVPVGTAVVRVASVRWHKETVASRRAQQVPSDTIASSKGGGGAGTVGGKNGERAEEDAFGDGDNPYGLRLTGSFMSYKWEESEAREVSARLKGLEPVLRTEEAVGDRLQKRADALVERLDGYDSHPLNIRAWPQQRDALLLTRMLDSRLAGGVARSSTHGSARSS